MFKLLPTICFFPIIPVFLVFLMCVIDKQCTSKELFLKILPITYGISFVASFIVFIFIYFIASDNMF